MKKIIALVLSLMLVLCSVAALAEDVVYHGFGAYTTASSSSNATADGNGTVQVNTNMASVVVNADGTIVSIILDTQQTKVQFNNAGEIVTDVTVPFPTKVELKDGYNMRGASPIGMEYFEQIAGLENWLVGKTVADLKAAIEGKDETLLAVCTIKLGDTVISIENAVNDALGL